MSKPSHAAISKAIDDLKPLPGFPIGDVLFIGGFWGGIEVSMQCSMDGFDPDAILAACVTKAHAELRYNFTAAGFFDIVDTAMFDFLAAHCGFNQPVQGASFETTPERT